MDGDSDGGVREIGQDRVISDVLWWLWLVWGIKYILVWNLIVKGRQQCLQNKSTGNLFLLIYFTKKLFIDLPVEIELAQTWIKSLDQKKTILSKYYENLFDQIIKFCNGLFKFVNNYKLAVNKC